MFNLVVITGRLTSDPELKATPNGVPVTSFSIANDIGYGENKKTAFIPIVAWRGTAEFISKNFTKGSLIGIQGAIQTRKYTDNNGNNRTVFEVVADKAEFVAPKSTPTNVSIAKEGNGTSTSKIDTTEQFKTQLDNMDSDLPF